jgi:ATP-dependent DNA helicase PIF1
MCFMNMQLKMEGLRYLLVDERSMVGRRMLGRVDSRMKQAFANELLLGGVSVVFLGENAVMLWAA